MKNISNDKCPNCGFDFSEIKPQLEMYPCKCGRSLADISEHYIRILSEIVPVENKKKEVKLDRGNLVEKIHREYEKAWIYQELSLSIFLLYRKK